MTRKCVYKWILYRIINYESVITHRLLLSKKKTIVNEAQRYYVYNNPINVKEDKSKNISA